MNNCEQVKDVILTDYIDGNMDKATKEHLERHLLTCSDCREFAKEVKANLVVPFQQVGREPVPEHLWGSIKAQIEEEQMVSTPQTSFLNGLLDSIFPKLTPIFASLVVLMLVGSFVFKQHVQQEQHNKEYLSSLLNSGEETDTELGTSIEQYFL